MIFFCTKDKNVKNEDAAVKLIKEYNIQFFSKADKHNAYQLTALTKERLDLWFDLKAHIKGRIQGTELEKLFCEKYEKGDSISYKRSMDVHFSEAGFFRGLNEIYEMSMHYACYHRLVLVD